MKTTCALFTLAIACAPAAAQYASCTVLQSMNGQPIQSRGTCISADGKVVCGQIGTPGDIDDFDAFRGFRWTAETGIVAMPQVPFYDSGNTIWAVNGDGSVLVGHASVPQGLAGSAFYWTEESGCVIIGDLPGGDIWSTGYAVSRDGSVIAGEGANEFSDQNAVRWTAQTGMVDISEGIAPAARGISPDGTVIVGIISLGEYGHQAPYRRTAEEGLVSLGFLPGGSEFGRARAVNLDNSVIVGQSDSDIGKQAFRWTKEGGMVGLGQLVPGNGALATAVSDDGNTIVGTATTSIYGSQAFLWTPELGMVNLRDHLIALGVKNLTNRVLKDATGISADGMVIVGTSRFFKNKGQQYGPEFTYIVHLGTTACYPDCDGTGSLDIDDFVCFQTLFATNDLGADCDASGALDIDDFLCFQGAFAVGCS